MGWDSKDWIKPAERKNSPTTPLDQLVEETDDCHEKANITIYIGEDYRSCHSFPLSITGKIDHENKEKRKDGRVKIFLFFVNISQK
jgi:hypothetical protein